MKKRMVNRSIVFTWFFSYMAVLLIPLGVFIYFSLRSIQALDSEVRYYNLLAVQQLQSSMDTIIRELFSITEEAAGSSEIKKVLQSAHGEKPQPLDLYYAQERVNKIFARSRAVEDVFIYCPPLNLTVGKTAYGDPKLFYDSYYADSSVPYEQWLILLSSRYASFTVADADTSSHKIMFVRPLTVLPRGQPYANIVFVLDRGETQISTSKSSEFQPFLILDTSVNDIVYNSAGSLIAGAARDPRLYKPGSFTFNYTVPGLTDETYIFAVRDSAVLGWKYASVQKRSIYMEQQRIIGRTAVLSLLICLFLGFFFVAVFIRSSYRPVSRVLRLIGDDSNKSGLGQGNEIARIGDAISMMQKEKNEMISGLEMQRSVVRSQLLNALAEKYDDAKIPPRSILAQYNITFRSDVFMIVLMDNADDRKPYEEFFHQRGCTVYFFTASGRTGMIINPSTAVLLPVPDVYSALYSIICECMASCPEQEMSWACSDICSSYIDLYGARMQAQDVLEYCSFSGCSDIHSYREMTECAAGSSFEYSVDTELQIMDELKKGNEQEVRRIIEDLIVINREKNITPKAMRFLLLNIAGSVIKVMSRLEEKNTGAYPDISIDAVAQNEPISQVKEDLFMLIRSVCRLVKHSGEAVREGEDRELFDRIVFFIKDNFSDKNMSLTSISDIFASTPVTVSRLFKKYCGDGISDFITQVRIEQAKIFMRSSQPLEQIADQCGFGSLRTFMRVFKNSEGVTPGQFKRYVGKEL